MSLTRSLLRRPVVPAVILSAVCSAAASAAVPIEMVARSGQAAPGFAGDMRFGTFSRPTVNDDGTVVFVSRVSGPGGPSTITPVIYAGAAGGTLEPVVVVGQPVPGTSDGSVIGNSTTPVYTIDNAGRVAIAAPVTGGATSGNGFFVSTPGGGLTTVARVGQQAPGYAAGVTYIPATTRLPVPDDNGGVTFVSRVQGPGITAANDAAIFAGPLGNVQPLVRNGDAAPGTGPGVVYSIFGDVSVNRSGAAAFQATLAGPGVVTPPFAGAAGNELAIYVGTQSPTLVARTGDVAPGTGVEYTALGDAQLDAAGRLVFRAVLSNADPSRPNVPNNGLFAYTAASGVRPLLRSGDAAADAPAGVTYASVGVHELGGGGDAAFVATLAGTGVTSSNESALYVLSADGTPTLAAREGDAAAGGAGQFASFSRVDVNAAGQVAFLATLRNTGSTNDVGLFVYDPALGVVPIVREGDLVATDVGALAVAEGGVGFITSTTLEPTHVFGDDGRVAFTLQFSFGFEGVFVATVPEPTSLLASFALLGVATRRRR